MLILYFIKFLKFLKKLIIAIKYLINFFCFFRKLGTTKRGIGPTYSSKCFRIGVRLGDLLNDAQNFEKRFSFSLIFISEKE